MAERNSKESMAGRKLFPVKNLEKKQLTARLCAFQRENIPR